MNAANDDRPPLKKRPMSLVKPAPLEPDSANPFGTNQPTAEPASEVPTAAAPVITTPASAAAAAAATTPAAPDVPAFVPDASQAAVEPEVSTEPGASTPTNTVATVTEMRPRVQQQRQQATVQLATRTTAEVKALAESIQNFYGFRTQRLAIEIALIEHAKSLGLEVPLLRDEYGRPIDFE